MDNNEKDTLPEGVSEAAYLEWKNTHPLYRLSYRSFCTEQITGKKHESPDL